ncbi:MAG: carboxypeptidase regulatory-like domain-containing protein [Acidobacteria bacterium]|nr:carboxypeptidase regulatory-like domain-containing protein [Acidobacteriota bacterium]
MSKRIYRSRRTCIVVGVLLLAPAAALAQGISGTVSDNTGGVLPGVTVTAASPALIEGQRVAITDSQGLYSIVDLRPGVYTVTFGLPGFSTIIREGIELTTGFTANVDSAMAVGGIEETITVTGAAPVVDVQNVRRQTLVTDEVLSTLPMSTKHVNNLVTLTPGFTGLADVGGRYTSQVGGEYHGKAGTKVAMDGMGVENSFGNSSYQINAAAVQEMVLQTTGISADTNADGAVVNVIPKEGGNTFSGILAGFFANDSMEGQNLTPELQEKGLDTANETLKMWDQSISLGGPIKRDKLWFFFAGRSWGFSRKHAGVYWNQSTFPGAPDTGQPRYLTPPGAERQVVNFIPYVDQPDNRFSGRLEWYDSYLSRVTWQAAENHKFNMTYDEQRACNCGSTNASSMQESSSGYRFDPNRLLQFSWTSTQTSRLLLEAGGAMAISQWNSFLMPGVEADHVQVTDTGLGINYGNYAWLRGDPNNTDRYSQRFSVSYVTGSHNFKAGIQAEQLVDNVYLVRGGGNVQYRFNNGVPNRITQWSTPYLQRDRARDLGIYAQDQWTIDRLSINLGVRFDSLYGYSPQQDLPGEPHATNPWGDFARLNPWLGRRSYDARMGTPSWKDINPRLGVAYDLFGNGRTALKGSLGRYVAKIGTEITNANNPIVRSVNNTNRSWNDANLNYVPDCDLGNFAANGECGAIDNNNFGQLNPNAVQWDPDVLNGLRDSNWDMSAEIQQELVQGLSMTVGYYFNNAGYSQETNSKNRRTDNQAVTPDDYSPYCITAPRNPGLPGGGGNEICGLYDLNPDKFGQVDNIITRTTYFGSDSRQNHFFNVTFDGRIGNGIQFGGGIDTGKSIEDQCFTIDSPQDMLHCRVVTPFKAQTQYKAFGSIPLPGDLFISAAYQNLSGPAYDANLFIGNDAVMGLGRPLSAGFAVVPLVAPQTLFEERISRLDFRLSKIINYRRLRFQINLDAYNLMNTSDVRTVNSSYGSRWGYPNSIIDPRLVQIGGQIDF